MFSLQPPRHIPTLPDDRQGNRSHENRLRTSSTADQTLALQKDALKAAGCSRIFSDDGVSGAQTTRRRLDRALAALSRGGTLIVWKLDRLGRSLSHLVHLIADLLARAELASRASPIP